LHACDCSRIRWSKQPSRSSRARSPLGVLQGCYKSVTGVLQGYNRGVAGVLQGCCRGINKVLQRFKCYSGFTRVLEECFKRVTRVL
jgi:hypothetical protein